MLSDIIWPMKQTRKSKLLTVVGPTGVGKTALAIELANQFNGELISADSRQIYIGMDIATGKEVSQGNWEQQHGFKTLVINGVPIYGLDLVGPGEEFSVYDWQQSVLPIIDGIKSRNKLPIIVGGTGFYLQALQGKIETLAVKPNTELRHELERMSIAELLERLRIANETKLAQVDVQNKRRLIRAIEVAETSAQEPGDKVRGNSYYDLEMIGLTMERNALYAKVDKRIEQMFSDRLLGNLNRCKNLSIGSIAAARIKAIKTDRIIFRSRKARTSPAPTAITINSELILNSILTVCLFIICLLYHR